MPIISPTLPNDGETIDAQDVNGPFNAILGVLNGNIDDQNVKPGSLPWSVMDSFSNQIPASAMQDSGNLENFRADAKISFIPSGLIWSATTGLAAGMTSGEYYSNSGILLPITAITSRTFTASRDTYVSIAQNGSIAYSEVTNGAAQPSLPSNSNWLAKVVTNGSAVTGVTDMRQTAPIASHNVDFTTSGKIWWEELGRATAGVTTTSLSIASIAPRRYLKIILIVTPTGGTLNIGIRFNNDSSTNYAERGSTNGTSDAAAGSLYQINTKTAVDANRQFTTGEFENTANQEKLGIMETVIRGSAGAGNAPERKLGVYKWANTSVQITRVDAVDTGGTGDIAAGSELIILGHD